MAIEQGADFIECDLALTKDGVLVCLHDAYLSSVTNVASIEDFADRKVICYTYLENEIIHDQECFTHEKVKK